MKMVLLDELQALLLLSSLPESWETLVVSLSNSTPNDVVTLSKVTKSLLNEETRRKSLGTSSSEVLITENRGRSPNRSSNDCDKSRERLKSKSRKDKECFHCGKKGHFKRECQKFLREQKNDSNCEKSDKETTTTTATIEGDMIILFLLALNHVFVLYVMTQIG